MVSRSSDADVAKMVEPTVAWSNDLLRHHLSVAEHLGARIAALTKPADAGGRPKLAKHGAEGFVGLVDTQLRELELAIGHGFIAAPGVVDGDERYMLWLQRDGDLIKRLRLNFDTSDLDSYDYVNMDWYTKPARHRAAALTGPYLDYAGANRLVITITAPMLVADSLVGVVGIDLLAAQVEALITRNLRCIDAQILVVNEDRSVVATNSPRWMPGERLHTHPGEDLKDYAAVVELDPWTGWTLAVAQPLG